MTGAQFWRGEMMVVVFDGIIGISTHFLIGQRNPGEIQSELSEKNEPGN